MPEDDREAVAEFIRTRGITRCPTVCVLPTKAWFQPPTGSRWKSTQLSVTAYASTSRCSLATIFKLEGYTVALPG